MHSRRRGANWEGHTMVETRAQVARAAADPGFFGKHGNVFLYVPNLIGACQRIEPRRAPIVPRAASRLLAAPEIRLGRGAGRGPPSWAKQVKVCRQASGAAGRWPAVPHAAPVLTPFCVIALQDMRAWRSHSSDLRSRDRLLLASPPTISCRLSATSWTAALRACSARHPRLAWFWTWSPIGAEGRRCWGGEEGWMRWMRVRGVRLWEGGLATGEI